GRERTQVITAVAVATETTGLAQRIERAGDLASVIAADPLDDVGVEHRPGAERVLDGLKASGAIKYFGGAAGERDFMAAAEGIGHVETSLGPGAQSIEGRIHGHPHDPLQNDEVLIGLEARSERPLDLPVVVDVDVLIKHIDVLEPHDPAKQGGDRETRFAI